MLGAHLTLSIDCETTGLDFFHGSRPYFVTTCDDEGNQQFWQWSVNPLTRDVSVPLEDVAALQRLVSSVRGKMKYGKEVADKYRIVGQNIKFDVAAFSSIGVKDWPWNMTDDCIFAGHLLASNQKHDLYSMAVQFMGYLKGFKDPQHLEDKLEEAVKAARQYCRRHLPTWAIAKKGRADMPSVKDKSWKQDAWLPKTLRDFRYATGDPLPEMDEHPDWDDVLELYANADSALTLVLWKVQRQALRDRGLWEIYRKFCLPRSQVAFQMEQRGVSGNSCRQRELTEVFADGSDRAGRTCVGIAASVGHRLELPKSGNNKSLQECMFDRLKVPPVKWTPNGQPSLDKAAMDGWVTSLPAGSKQLMFVKQLLAKRKRDTALSYLESYQRFWLQLPGHPEEWFVLHPSLNPTGTDTLRWSSANPNSQNFSKSEYICPWCDGEKCQQCGFTGKEGHSLRYILGPAPGREWWSLDAKNIERRIPAYEAGEEEIIALLERPDEPPYYGSEHAMTGHTIRPEVFETCLNERGELDGRIYKKRHAATFYQWDKNFNFAVQYGCQEKKGDQAAHVQGAWRRIKQRFKRQEELNQHWIKHANRHGFVETIPDKSVDPSRGYPLLCTRTEWGGALPTVPLNYHVQGTACWVVTRWMIEAQRQLDAWRAEGGFDGHISMQVHDELVLDFPKLGDPTRHTTTLVRGEDVNRDADNLWRVKVIQGIITKIGQDIGIPLFSGAEFHPETWAEGTTI